MDRTQLVAPRRPLLTHGRQRADAPLVTRSPGLHALTQPRFLVSQALVELVPPGCVVCQPLILFAEEGRVVFRPRGQPTAIDVDDSRRDPLEERTVVGDEHDGARILGEERLQPDDGIEIEVIRRLVEQQYVWLGHQYFRKQHPASPSAGEGVDRRIWR